MKVSCDRAIRNIRERAPPLQRPTSRLKSGRPKLENGRVVLIVDDSMIVRERLGALIRDAEISCQVITAENGAAARAAFKAPCLALVVLDIALPDASGLDLLREFKQQHPETPVVMFTTYAFPEFRQRAESYGADFFFNKGVDFEKVCDVLRRLIPDPTAPMTREGDGG